MAERLIPGALEFYTVAKLKNFGAAAKELDVSMPTLSTAIQNLEKLVGKKLIERDSRFRKLTPIGLAYYEHLQIYIPAVQEMNNKLIHGTLKRPGKEDPKAKAEALFKPVVPGPVKKPKEFRPTPQLSDDVCLMKADGWEDIKIAAVIGISLEQLKEHFPNELEHGVERVRRRALRQLDKAAKKGNTSATNALLKLVGDLPTKFAPLGIAGGAGAKAVENTPKPKTPEPLGKKEQILADLADADKDSDWAGLVN